MIHTVPGLRKVEWCEEHEDLLKEWAEKARFYSWMHHTTSAKYNTLNNLMTIPMIIVSIVNGSINFTLVGNTSKSKLMTLFIPMLVGTLNIVTAILSSLTKFFKTAEMVEKHEMFYRQFNILVRNISLELSLPPEQRKPPTESLNLSRYDLDRLVNEAPRIPSSVIIKFNKQFPYKQNKPEIANFFNKIKIHGRRKLYKDKVEQFIRIRTFYKWRASLYAQESVYNSRLYKTSPHRRLSFEPCSVSDTDNHKRKSFDCYYNSLSYQNDSNGASPSSNMSIKIDIDDEISTE